MYEPPFSAIRRPIPRNRVGRDVRNASFSGCSATWSCFSSSTKVGLSLSRSRISTATAMRKIDARNGIRQTQLSSASCGT